MSTLKEQEINTAATLLQNKKYLNNESLQEQVFKGLFHFGIFQQMINDHELNRYLHPYLLNFVNQAQVVQYNQGKVLNMQGQNYNTLYLLFSGKVVFYLNKNTQELEKEKAYIDQEKQQYEQESKQMKEKLEQQQQELQKNQKAKGKQKGNGNNLNSKALQIQKELAKNQKVYGEVYKLMKGESKAVTTSSSALKSLQHSEDNMLRNSAQCSSQYYSGPMCLYKINDTKRPGDYFGEIVNNVRGRKAEKTIIVSEPSIILQINGLAFYQIFKNVIYQLNFVYQVLELMFRGYTKRILLEIALNSERRDYKQDQAIYSEQSVSTGFYIIKEGEVAIQQQKKKIKFMKKGTVFGLEDMFYKKRKFDAVSDSNKTVVFEILKKKINNFYFLNDVKNRGEPLLQNLLNLAQSEGNQSNKSQIKQTLPGISNIESGQNLNNLTNNTSNNVRNSMILSQLSQSQVKMLHKFQSNRGSLSLSTLEADNKNIRKKQNNSTLYGKNNNVSMSNLNLSKLNQPGINSNKVISQKEAPKNDTQRSNIGEGDPTVERFSMIRDQDIFNDEDYSEYHYQEIKMMKKVNKIQIDKTGRKVFIMADNSHVFQKSKSHNFNNNDSQLYRKGQFQNGGVSLLNQTKNNNFVSFNNTASISNFNQMGKRKVSPPKYAAQNENKQNSMKKDEGILVNQNGSQINNNSNFMKNNFLQQQQQNYQQKRPASQSLGQVNFQNINKYNQNSNNSNYNQGGVGEFPVSNYYGQSLTPHNHKKSNSYYGKGLNSGGRSPANSYSLHINENPNTLKTSTKMLNSHNSSQQQQQSQQINRQKTYSAKSNINNFSKKINNRKDNVNQKQNNDNMDISSSSSYFDNNIDNVGQDNNIKFAPKKEDNNNNNYQIISKNKIIQDNQMKVLKKQNLEQLKKQQEEQQIQNSARSLKSQESAQFKIEGYF